MGERNSLNFHDSIIRLHLESARSQAHRFHMPGALASLPMRETLMDFLK